MEIHFWCPLLQHCMCWSHMAPWTPWLCSVFGFLSALQVSLTTMCSITLPYQIQCTQVSGFHGMPCEQKVLVLTSALQRTGQLRLTSWRTFCLPSVYSSSQVDGYHGTLRLTSLATSNWFCLGTLSCQLTLVSHIECLLLFVSWSCTSVCCSITCVSGSYAVAKMGLCTEPFIVHIYVNRERERGCAKRCSAERHQCLPTCITKYPKPYQIVLCLSERV